MVGSAHWLTGLLRPEYFILNAGLIFKKIHNIEQSLKDQESRALEEFWVGQSSKKGPESSSYTALSNRKTHALDDSLRQLSVLELWLQSTEDFSTEGWFSTSQSSVVRVLCFLMNFTYKVLGSYYIQKDLDTASKQRGRLPVRGRKAEVTNCVFLISDWFPGLFINALPFMKPNKNVWKCLHTLIVQRQWQHVIHCQYHLSQIRIPRISHTTLPTHRVKPTAGYNGKIFKIRNKDNHGHCRPLK